MRTALTGRTHGRTDQARDVKILLANPEPSTQGTLPTCPGRSGSSATGRPAVLKYRVFLMALGIRRDIAAHDNFRKNGGKPFEGAAGITGQMIAVTGWGL